MYIVHMVIYSRRVLMLFNFLTRSNFWAAGTLNERLFLFLLYSTFLLKIFVSSLITNSSLVV
jgi:hypothetical protein